MGYKWVTNGTIQYVIDSITKRVSERDAEQELVSTKCYRFYNKTC